LGLPLYTFDTALEAMKEGRLKYDLGLSVLYWRKLRDEFLTVPRLGTINFHPALLPEYKGTGGYNLAIMDELSEWGSTAHYVDASIDTGEIIEVDRFPIDSSVETAQSLERKTMQALEPFAQRIIARAVEAQAKLPTTPNIGGRYGRRRSGRPGPGGSAPPSCPARGRHRRVRMRACGAGGRRRSTGRGRTGARGRRLPG